MNPDDPIGNTAPKLDVPRDKLDVQRRLVELAREFSIIDPEFEKEPAMRRRLIDIAEQIPDHAVQALLDHSPPRRARHEPSISTFCAAHAISPAEARLLESLIAGKTVSDHAAECGISITTARTHMRRLQEKTGAANQTDLVRRYFISRP